MVSPTSAAAVANAFLEIQDADGGNYPRIDQMKLQKLLYYANAWWLAFNGEPLFDEDIEAWPWGPVVRNVYLEFREFGRKPIVGRRATEVVVTNDDPYKIDVREPAPPGNDVEEFLKSVWETHKQFSGVQLSNATHAEGEPWHIIKSTYGDLDAKPTIPNKLIRDVFKRKIDAAAPATAA